MVRKALYCPERNNRAPYLFRCAQIMVFDRSEAIQKVLETCRNKLHIKKKVKGAALLDGEEVLCLNDSISPAGCAQYPPKLELCVNTTCNAVFRTEALVTQPQ